MKLSFTPADPLASIAATLPAVAIAAGAAALLWFLSDVVLLLFGAVLIAAMLRGLANALHRATHLPVRAAVAVVSLLVVAVIAALGYWAGPRILTEGRQLGTELVARIHQLQSSTGAPPGITRMLTEHLGGSSGQGGGLLRPGLDLVRSTIGTLGSALVVLVAGIYLAITPDMYVNGAVRLMPVSRRPRTREIMQQMTHTMRYWSLGQCIDMAVVGTLSGVGLELAGVPLALALAVLAGLLTFVPYFGAIAGSIPALIIAGTLGWSKVFWVVGIFLVCHAVEGYVVAPVVQRHTVELPPALTVVAMLVLGATYGALGLILATPAIAAILVLVREAYVVDTLGDREMSESRPVQ